MQNMQRISSIGASKPGQTQNLKINYLQVKEELETFSCGILTKCQNMAEVRTILEHRPEKEMIPNFEKAIFDGHVDFVSHPYLQEHFERRWIGKHYEGPGSSHLLQYIHIPYALLLFCFYPFVVFADLFRQADILFVAEDPADHKLFSFFRNAIHTPHMRQNVHGTLHVTYPVLLLLMMSNPMMEVSGPEKKTDIYILDYIVLAVTTILLLEEVVDFVIMKKEGRAFFDSFWNFWNTVLSVPSSCWPDCLRCWGKIFWLKSH